MQWLSLAPTVWLFVVLVEQSMDVNEIRSMSFFTDHPWYVFTACISLVLCSASVWVWLTSWWPFAMRITSTFVQVDVNDSVAVHRWREETEVFLYALDGTWGFMWLIQFLVHVLLPRQHRAFTLTRIANIVLIYTTKCIVSIICTYYAYQKYRKYSTHQKPGSGSPLRMQVLYKTIK